MSSNYYVLSDGNLSAEEGVFRFDSKTGMKRLPVENVSAINFYGGGTLTTGSLRIAEQNNIPIHFFGYYGNYIGTFWPKEHYFSGDLTVKQVEVYLNPERRLELSTTLLRGIVLNMNNLLRRFGGGEPLDTKIVETDINMLMLEEARIRKEYYSRLDTILPEEFMIIKRERNPPSNYGNCLISFGNSLLYSEIVTQARKVSLNPSISFYHSPESSRFSLALDLSEPLKPGIVDRFILQMTKEGILRPSIDHFAKEGNGILLNGNGKKIFLQHWEEWMNSANYNERMKRRVSHRERIRFELHKYAKDIVGIEKYSPATLPEV